MEAFQLLVAVILFSLFLMIYFIMRDVEDIGFRIMRFEGKAKKFKDNITCRINPNASVCGKHRRG